MESIVELTITDFDKLLIFASTIYIICNHMTKFSSLSEFPIVWKIFNKKIVILEKVLLCVVQTLLDMF